LSIENMFSDDESFSQWAEFDSQFKNLDS